jgi:hypothetical protein
VADQPLALRSDSDLEAALRAFGEDVAWPAAADGEGRDVAATVRARIESSPRTVAPARPRWSWWPARRALVAAVLILLVLAAIAGAATLGLPGLLPAFLDALRLIERVHQHAFRVAGVRGRGGRRVRFTQRLLAQYASYI